MGGPHEIEMLKHTVRNLQDPVLCDKTISDSMNDEHLNGTSALLASTVISLNKGLWFVAYAVPIPCYASFPVDPHRRAL